MSKSKQGQAISEEEEPPVIVEEVIPAEPHFLTEESLYLWKVWQKEESPREFVPPQTPNSEYDFGNTFHPFPETFPELDNLEVPYVRDKGVKFCIDALAEYFECKDYRFNLLQFWFLDVLADCLWTTQDNFRLPVDQQKIVLAWILYLINLVRDPQKNMTRKKFFTVFKEAMLVAAEVVDEGCETVPLPEKLFALIQEEGESIYWTSSDSECKSSSSSLEISDTDFDNVSCVELEIDDKRRKFVLPEEACNCAKFDLSSVASVQESDSLAKDLEKEKLNEEEKLREGEEEEEEEKLEDIAFYQPYSNIPSRFLPLPEETIEDMSIEAESQPEKPMCKIENNTNQNTDENLTQTIPGDQSETGTGENIQGQCDVYEIPEKFCMQRTSEISESAKTFSDTIGSSASKSEQINQNQQERDKTKFQEENLQPDKRSADKVFFKPELLEKYKKKQILKSLAFQKLLEQRLKDMDNPRKGWIPSPDEIDTVNKNEEVVEEEEEQTSEENDASEDEEWADITLEHQNEQIQNDADKLVLNFGVLRAIIDFTFKYFYESFQFSLIKLAFQATPEIISQQVNHEWKIPKKIKQELQKPKVEKEKKPKKEKKEKAPKKGKEDKEKKDKASTKNKKESEKSSKKKEQKEKKPKPVPLTKEEKAELERQRKEQARLEEELRKLEENKRFMFPLTEAATDDLFKNIFENWVKVDLAKKGKGKEQKGKK